MSVTTASSKSLRRARRSTRRGLLARPRAVLRLLTDRTAPKLPRIVALIAVLYAIFPLDLVPDVLPLIGWIDDLGLATIAVTYVLSAAARHEERRAAELADEEAPALAVT